MTLQYTWTRYLALAVTGLLLLLVSLPPFAPPSIQALLMTAFAPVCHQLPDRSFWIDGVQLAVCQRCYGIYAGLFLGTSLLLTLSAKAAWIYQQACWVLAAALLPAMLDWGLPIVHLWYNTPLTRTFTGLWFGLLAGLLLTATLEHTACKAQPQPA